jgi:alkanesulfonate monooxygenase SsuD/methylene tetrahydromethanopterin reductase-like flavin-dependent oxidoreductase (luciferase family)
VGETDEEARRVARAAYKTWRSSMSHLWRQKGVAYPLEASHPLEWDAYEAAGLGIAGTERTVREYVSAQTAEAHANFMLCHMVFGGMAYEDALHSLERFASGVMAESS